MFFHSLQTTLFVHYIFFSVELLFFLRKGAGAPLCLMDYYILLMYTSIDVIPSHRSFPLFSETHLYASFAP